MSKRLCRLGCSALAVLSFALLSAAAPTAFAKPILMPTLTGEIQTQQQIWS
ncbi:MAG: hypothetical protein ABI323_02070 [Solirubrobacteraceae bacterium]